MSIGFMVEGETERTFLPVLRTFLETRLAGRMPRIRTFVYQGRLPKEHKLRRDVRLLLLEHDAVIALTDVYTGTRDFVDAQDARTKMRHWAGEFGDRFYPNAAQYDFEAWLLPYWDRIQELSGYRGAPPAGPPERVNHQKPPSWHIDDAFRRGGKRGGYVKPRDARRILEGCDFLVAVRSCPELKALVNSFLAAGGGEPLP